ncbi:heterodisulfide reductase-related iron-sulfur binding cluster [Chloroflexota bacterium]
MPLVFGQWTLLKGLKVNDRAGITHFFIFWGGIAFLLGYLFFVFGPAFSNSFAEKVLGNNGAIALSFAVDILGILAFISVIWGLIRRFVLKPERQTASFAWLYFSLTIAILLLTYFMMEAIRLIMLDRPTPIFLLPIGVMLANCLTSLHITGNLELWYNNIWWLEFLVIVGFLIHSRYSEHMHAVAAPINFFFKRLEPKGSLESIDLETAKEFSSPSIQNLTWKERLDALTCTECGRCQMACPAYVSGKVLNPKQILQSMRSQILSKESSLPNERLSGNEIDFGVGSGGISEEAVWNCTTCFACQQECPMAIEHVGLFVELRRQLVERGSVSRDIRNTLENIRTLGNPWGQTQSNRLELARQLRLPLLQEEGEVDFLFWIGCLSAYDNRARDIVWATSSLLSKAGIKYAVLGSEEKCCGDPTRRMGEEGLFQQIALSNIDIFKHYNIRRIITHCPHCYNTFKNEYCQLGADLEVIHHSEMILKLIQEGIITINKPLNYSLTFHDPCYLGRYNDLYNLPRQVIQANKHLKLVEMKNNRQSSFCCGAGGGHFWMTDFKGQRIENIRLAQALETGSQLVATACPYCVVMLDTAASTMETGRRIKVMDIAELVNESLF